MNCIGRGTIAGTLLLLVISTVVAGEAAKVAWQNDLAHAWQATQQQGRPLLVFVTREKCLYCDQMKDRTYSSEAVVTAIRQSFVPLVLDGGKESPLLKELRVTMYPATFVISPQAVVVGRFEGYVPPEVLIRRLNALRPQTPVARIVKDP